MSASLVNGRKGEPVAMSFINDTSRFITLKPNTILGEAIESEQKPVTWQESLKECPLLDAEEEQGDNSGGEQESAYNNDDDSSDLEPSECEEEEEQNMTVI